MTWVHSTEMLVMIHVRSMCMAIIFPFRKASFRNVGLQAPMWSVLSLGASVPFIFSSPLWCKPMAGYKILTNVLCNLLHMNMFHLWSFFDGEKVTRTSEHVHVTDMSFSADDAPTCWARRYGSEALISSIYSCISVCISVYIYGAFHCVFQLCGVKQLLFSFWTKLNSSVQFLNWTGLPRIIQFLNWKQFWNWTYNGTVLWTEYETW